MLTTICIIVLLSGIIGTEILLFFTGWKRVTIVGTDGEKEISDNEISKRMISLVAIRLAGAPIMVGLVILCSYLDHKFGL